MDKLGLSEIIRYSATGFVVIAIAYVCEPVSVKAIVSDLGALGLPVGAFVLGCLVFFVYRPTIYKLLLFRVLDSLHRANIRNVLMQRYAIKRRTEAETLWDIRQKS